MARDLHRGIFRTAIGYVLFVMGGATLFLLLRIAFGGSWFFDSHGYIHPGFGATFSSGITFFLLTLTDTHALIWLLLGALLYLLALAFNKLPFHSIVSKLLLALISMLISARIIVYFSPVQLPSLPALYLTMMVAGLLGAIFGFWLASRVSNESFQVSPLGWGYLSIAGAWILILCMYYGYHAYVIHKLNSIKDPPLNFLFVTWTPAEGEVHEELNSKSDPRFSPLKDVEIQQLRAAGMTGILKVQGGVFTFTGPPRSRFIVIMSRGTKETIDLPKPATGDVIYVQTQEGWKAFPPSTPTLPRTVRLRFSEPNKHHTSPETVMTNDFGLGHRGGDSGLTAFTWPPEAFEAPLPSIPDRVEGSGSSR